MSDYYGDLPPQAKTLISALLDEVYDLRRGMAYEAQVVHATLGYATIPKTRRKTHEEQIERMRQAARGEVFASHRGISHSAMTYALKEAGARDGLSRFAYERALHGEPENKE